MTLEQSLSIGDREVISLVGGGGKTTLMYALGRELSSHRKGIILTTTTKILEPKPSSFFLQFLSNELGEVKKWVAENIHCRHCLLIARERLPNGKLEGIFPEWIEDIFRMDGVSTIINEADGSAGRPLKALREKEPVIPKNTTLLVPVMGIDGMGVPLDEESVFRSAIASRLLNLPIGSMITEDVIARLMKELMKSSPTSARVVLLINKIDIPGGLEKAQKLAQYLLSTGMPTVRRVVLCSLRHSPVVQVIAKRSLSDS
jgi:probable selenium-dependent hydroxylase accessory protein YqeC